VIVAWIFVACVVVQTYLAGLGVFDRPGTFLTHRDFGYMFGILTLVMIVLAVVGRLPRRVLGASAGLLALFALQSVFIAFRADVPTLAALHPVNGYVILLLAVWVAWSTRGYLRTEPA
jgi:hypothetical protein